MKKIYGFAALCAAMTLASCSNNDEPNVVDNGGETKTCYFAVNLAAPLDTRADHGKPVAGEYEVKTVTFVCFDESGHVVTTVKPENVTFTPEAGQPSASGNVNSKSNNMLVQVSQKGNQKVGYVMTILNAPDLDFSDTSKTIDDVRHTVLSNPTRKLKLAADGKTWGVSTDSDATECFVMTNSAYEADGNTISGGTTKYLTYATNFIGKVYETSQLAEQPGNVVSIYVERAAARVDVTKDANFQVAGVAGVGEDGNAATFNVTLEKVGFIYNPNKANLVKDIDGLDTSCPYTDWKDYSNYRTHWAKSPALNYFTAAELTADATKTCDYNKVYFSTTDLDQTWKTATKNFYINENTSSNSTYILLTGTIYVGESTTAQDIYQLWQTGEYYTVTSAKNQLCKLLEWDNYRFIYTNSDPDATVKEVSATVNPTDISIVQISGHNYGYVQIKGKKDIVKDGVTYQNAVLCKGGSPVTLNAKSVATASANDEFTTYVAAATEDAETAKKYRVYKYDKGKTYYYSEIKPETVGVAGVVRNHLYDVTFSAIGGLGTALFDGDEELIPRNNPVNPDKDPKWYFDTKIEILNWKVYTQNMNFGVVPETPAD